MASPSNRRSNRDTPPGELPDVTPSRYQPHTHDHTLQAVIEMRRSVGELSAKVERLIDDVGKQGEKVADLRDKFNVFKGVWMVIAFFGIFIVPVATWFLNRSFPPGAPATAQATRLDSSVENVPPVSQGVSNDAHP